MLQAKLRLAELSHAPATQPGALSVTAIPDEWHPPKEFVEVRNRITALGRTANLSKAEKQNRLRQLEAMGEEIERKWRDTDVEKYARLMFRVSGTIGGMDVPAGRRNYIAQNVALRARRPTICRLTPNVTS